MPTKLADRIHRNEAWISRDAVDRPMIGLEWEPDIRPLPQFLEMMGNGSQISPEQVQLELFLPHVEADFQRDSQLCTDIIQPFAPGFGIPWVEAIAGCPVVAGTNSVWTRPVLDSYDDRPPITFDPENPWLLKLLEFTRALVDLSDGRFPVAHPPLHRPLYALAGMVGEQRLCIDLIENPDAVKKAMCELADLWIRVAGAVLEIIPPFHGGYSTWMKLYAPGKAVNLQNEFAPLISSRMYEEFAHPLDDEPAAFFPYQSFHLHGSAAHQIEALLRLDGLTMIQLPLEHHVGGPSLEVMLPIARRILEKKALLLVPPDVETAEICLRELPAAGLCVAVMVVPRELGHEYDEWLGAHCTRA